MSSCYSCGMWGHCVRIGSKNLTTTHRNLRLCCIAWRRHPQSPKCYTNTCSMCCKLSERKKDFKDFGLWVIDAQTSVKQATCSNKTYFLWIPPVIKHPNVDSSTSPPPVRAARDKWSKTLWQNWDWLIILIKPLHAFSGHGSRESVADWQNGKLMVRSRLTHPMCLQPANVHVCSVKLLKKKTLDKFEWNVQKVNLQQIIFQSQPNSIRSSCLIHMNQNKNDFNWVRLTNIWAQI